MLSKTKLRRNVQMGDTQVKPGVPLNHLQWIQRYVNEHKFDLFVDSGDFLDAPSLNYWTRGKLEAEGSRIKADFDAANFGLELLHKGLKVRKRIVTKGNHEHRADRVPEDDPRWEGFISSDQVEFHKWYDVVGEFLEVVTEDGIGYCHYFQRANSGKPWSGTMFNRLQKIGYSHVAGHSPGFEFLGQHLGNGSQRCGMVNGACYLHYENYKGPQDNLQHFRGIVVMNEVDGAGGFLPMPVSLEYLCRRYENVTLKQFARQSKKWIVFGDVNKDAMRWLL